MDVHDINERLPLYQRSNLRMARRNRQLMDVYIDASFEHNREVSSFGAPSVPAR
jgi:hypothetical protein